MKLEDIIKLDKEILKNKIIVFPTDTVYGVGCLYNDIEAYKKIYELKKRSFDKPLAVLISKMDHLQLFNEELDSASKELINKYWPGALTVILKKKKDSDAADLFNNQKIGLRMPNSRIALKLIDHFGPLATTSVNISGEKELNSIEEIKAQFGDLIDYYIDDIEPMSKISSTVIELFDSSYRVLREGSIKIINKGRNIMKVAVGSDHAGLALKRELIKIMEVNSITVIDYGTYSSDSCDYPDYAAKVAKEVISNNAEFGILICYTGIGMSIAANKFKGIRAALVNNVENAKLTREHNNANILCLGAKDVDAQTAIEIIKTFLTTPFSNGERHQRRIDKITKLEETSER